MEFYGTANFGIEGIVRAKTGILAGVELCAVLADDDLAPLHDLAAEALDAKALGIGIASVAGTTAAFLMCHF